MAAFSMVRWVVLVFLDGRATTPGDAGVVSTDEATADRRRRNMIVPSMAARSPAPRNLARWYMIGDFVLDVTCVWCFGWPRGPLVLRWWMPLTIVVVEEEENARRDTARCWLQRLRRASHANTHGRAYSHSDETPRECGLSKTTRKLAD
jgi:hypothetical protein